MRRSLPRSLSYTAISAYHRCGYRFYVERILGLPGRDSPGGIAAAGSAPVGTAPVAPEGMVGPGEARDGGGGPTGTDRGTLVHGLLRDLDLTAGHELPAGTPVEIAEIVEAFGRSSTAARLAAARQLRREQPFTFRFDELLITGVYDAVAREPGAGGRSRWLIVDYKTDRLLSAPEALVRARYATQQSLYALAALSAGADEVEVVHLFSEAPEQPVTARFTSAAIPLLESELEQLLAGLRAGEYRVSDNPGPSLCAGCPAAGGLCSHPASVTGY